MVGEPVYLSNWVSGIWCNIGWFASRLFKPAGSESMIVGVGQAKNVPVEVFSPSLDL